LYYFQIDPHLFLINLDQKIKGFRNFISSWLYRDEDITFLVDPGPSRSIEALKKVLDELGVREIDYILLTHIHIDHAGGAGTLPEHFPGVKILCHPKGIEHMINPAKLWKGSIAVLGDIARAYGEIIPVPQESIFYGDTIENKNQSIEVILTPGHAPHHLSFSFKQYLFAGEAAGVHQSLPDTIYARPATPPKFKLETSLSSLDKVITKKPKIVCYGHYGLNREGVKALAICKEQLVLWTNEVREQLASGKNFFEKKVIESLMEKDKLFSNYKYLENDIKKREDYFIHNSIKGMKEYVESEKRGC